jgi:hypothetical protein
LFSELAGIAATATVVLIAGDFETIQALATSPIGLRTIRAHARGRRGVINTLAQTYLTVIALSIALAAVPTIRVQVNTEITGP